MSRTLSSLNIGYDPVKHERNTLQRNIPFSMVSAFEFDSALIVVDDRQDYGEIREAAIGFIGERVHVLIFTIRAETLWVISLRKANKREIRRYVDYLEEND
ncbi:BrnT family toxin [Rhizobium sp. 32-5/1]|uniref:BrnT family toxin n=1 Tax=Rhizobium sp. 32-5/1 TaxID=3019602 RepID=UPI00240D2DC2|nr:BrnT family toxin [Rhizobium sp. 32-5/1]WEZ84791.1 BrnT family toxin [Rhizobium sp. 32-5/1]